MKLSVEKFKKKNVTIKPSKRSKIPDICFSCPKLNMEDKYWYCENAIKSYICLNKEGL